MNFIGFDIELDLDLKVIVLLKKKLLVAPIINEIIFDKEAVKPKTY